MKKIFLILMFSMSSFFYAQIVSINGTDIPSDMPPGSYIKDIDGAFDKFGGTWIWTSGNKKVTFKLQKVIHFLDPEYNNYSDFMIGDYSYTFQGMEIVNTINQNSNPDPDLHPMYACCPRDNKITFTFKDVVIQKDQCRAFFEFLPGSMTQMKLTLKNNDALRGVLLPEGSAPVVPVPFNYDFTIPNNIVLTKQP